MIRKYIHSLMHLVDFSSFKFLSTYVALYSKIIFQTSAKHIVDSGTVNIFYLQGVEMF
jgi:hypothetical protein